MGKAGIDKLMIINVGRWKTLIMLERYLTAAQYKKVAEISELADERTTSSTALEDGLKDVKELLSRVLEKPWSVWVLPNVAICMIAGCKVRLWWTSHAGSDWICHQESGRHIAVDSAASLLRRCSESQFGQLGHCVGNALKKRCGEACGAGGKQE